MPIPSSFLDELKSRVSIADIAARYVTWDRPKSNFSQGDYWACCPFHSEKSPSFHVLDRKGFFYCFGCHERGSALDLVMKLENKPFREAVEDLARGVGMTLPEEDPQTRAREKKRLELADAMEAAVAFYRQMLFSGAGGAARAYLLETRGLRPEALERFEIGYAPDAWEALTPALVQAGFGLKQLVEAGLSKESDRGRAPFDLFRDRIMFPIRDPRGRCVAFGGRAMSKEAQAKYLNSPATPLFDKSRTLYNLGPAQTSIAEAGSELIVAEGYMDVIALSEAGFGGAVAPLGTAMTEAHLEQLWRRADAPVLALDGDKAGLRAAHRAAELALPKLVPGKTLRMAFLPNGQDPDDLLRSDGGVPAMAQLVEQARPLVDVLWERAVASARLATPEDRALFEAELDALAERIQHPTVRAHYRQAFRDRRFQFFRELNRRGAPGRGEGKAGRRGGGAQTLADGPRPETRASRMAGVSHSGTGVGDVMRGRECVLIAALLHHPSLAEEAQSALEAIELLNPQLETARSAILSALADAQECGVALDAEAVEVAVDLRCGAGVSANVTAEIAGKLPRALLRGADPQAAAGVFVQLLHFHAGEVCWIRERSNYLEELAQLDLDGEDIDPHGATPMDERLRDAHRAAHAAAMMDDSPSAGGADKRNSQRLQSFVDAEPWKKRARRAG